MRTAARTTRPGRAEESAAGASASARIGRGGEAGFSFVELLVSLTLLVLLATGLAEMMVDNSRLNRSQQMTADVRANAQNCLTLVVQKLRSAGWDPMNAGLPVVALDPDLGDAISQIEVFADVDADGDTDGANEQMLIRHSGGQVEWRPNSDVNEPFVVLARGISNDADGDGTPEPMFVVAAPGRITVRITAESANPDPLTGDVLRFTATTDVFLRGAG